MNSNRYSRHISLNEIGPEKQAGLAQRSVGIIGCGGLGSIAAPYLAGAGVGKLVLVDGDIPDISNIHRQVFYSGKENSTKAELMASHLKKINPLVTVEFSSRMLSKNNISDILDDLDIVLDCTDDIQSKYLCNDFCHLNKIPLIYASIYKFEGLVSFFENKNEDSIHLRDFYPEPDSNIPSCSEVGVLNTLAGTIGMLQANEALKYLLDIGTNLIGKLLSYDALDNSQNIINLTKNWRSDIKTIFEDSNYAISFCKDALEIIFADYLASKDQYKLICILEDEEYEFIDEDVIHIPLSTIDARSWKPIDQLKSIFYCKSGQRSAKLVNELSLLNPDLDIFSLKGGLNSIPKE